MANLAQPLVREVESVPIPLDRIVEAFVGPVETVSPTICVQPQLLTFELTEEGLVITAEPVAEVAHG